MGDYDILPYFAATPTPSQLASYNIYAKISYAGYPTKIYLGKSVDYDVFIFKSGSELNAFPIRNGVSAGNIRCVYFVQEGYDYVEHWRANSETIYGGQTFYRVSADLYGNEISPIIPVYSNIQAALDDYFNHPAVYPITYRLTNCTASSAPTEAAVGDTVNVPFTFPDGYGFPNPTTDVYVYNNGVLVPSSYANNVLTFTMPDPS